MTRFIGMLQTGFAIFLYLLSAVTFIDYMYSLTIPDTVTAIENAFGRLVILVFMLVLAKFSMAAGRKKLRETAASGDDAGSGDPGREAPLDPDQPEVSEEAEK